MTEWEYFSFNRLSVQMLYEVIKLRQDVFIIEQGCIYNDLDRLDQFSDHLLGLDRNKLAAYLRIVPAGKKYKEPSIGRVIVHPEYRGNELGNELIRQGITVAEEKYGKVPLRIEAQAHLEFFYSKFGFRTVTSPFDVDGIPHIEMLRE